MFAIISARPDPARNLLWTTQIIIIGDFQQHFCWEPGARGSYSVVRYAKFIEREVPQSLWLEYAVKVPPAHPLAVPSLSPMNPSRWLPRYAILF